MFRILMSFVLCLCLIEGTNQKEIIHREICQDSYCLCESLVKWENSIKEISTCKRNWACVGNEKRPRCVNKFIEINQKCDVSIGCMCGKNSNNGASFSALCKKDEVCSKVGDVFGCGTAFINDGELCQNAGKCTCVNGAETKSVATSSTTCNKNQYCVVFDGQPACVTELVDLSGTSKSDDAACGDVLKPGESKKVYARAKKDQKCAIMNNNIAAYSKEIKPLGFCNEQSCLCKNAQNAAKVICGKGSVCVENEQSNLLECQTTAIFEFEKCSNFQKSDCLCVVALNNDSFDVKKISIDKYCFQANNKVTETDDYIEPNLVCPQTSPTCMCFSGESKSLRVVCKSGEACVFSQDKKSLICSKQESLSGLTQDKPFTCPSLNGAPSKQCKSNEICLSNGFHDCYGAERVIEEGFKCNDKNGCLCRDKKGGTKATVFCTTHSICTVDYRSKHMLCAKEGTRFNTGKELKSAHICLGEKVDKSATMVGCFESEYCFVSEDKKPKCFLKLLPTYGLCQGTEPCPCLPESFKWGKPYYVEPGKYCAHYGNSPASSKVVLQNGQKCVDDYCLCAVEPINEIKKDKNHYDVCTKGMWCYKNNSPKGVVSPMCKNLSELKDQNYEEKFPVAVCLWDIPKVGLRYFQCPTNYACDYTQERGPYCFGVRSKYYIGDGETCMHAAGGCVCVWNTVDGGSQCAAGQVCKREKQTGKCLKGVIDYFECPDVAPCYCHGAQWRSKKTEFCNLTGMMKTLDSSLPAKPAKPLVQLTEEEMLDFMWQTSDTTGLLLAFTGDRRLSGIESAQQERLFV